jgi:hypothetical protein
LPPSWRALIPGTFIPADNKSNDYHIDRVAQRNFSYTGIKTFPLQDMAMMEDLRTHHCG